MMRNGILVIGIAFAVALAAVVGNRLSHDALAVVVGALCGISATIPVTIGLVIAASRNWGRDEIPREIGYEYTTNRYVPHQPPVVIVAPPQPTHAASYTFPASPYLAPLNAPVLGAPREFKIIGEE
jgi:hypothetical protein